MVIPRRYRSEHPLNGGGRIHRNRWQLSRGISGRIAVEWVATLLWNQWQDSSGIRSTLRIAEKLLNFN